MNKQSDIIEKHIDWDSLVSQYEALIRENSDLRIRDIAEKLSVPEAALFEKSLGVKARRLKLNPSTQIDRFTDLGEVMVIVRNENAVHEQTGVYEKINIHEGPQMATVIGTDIEQRIFFSRWKYLYAFELESRKGTLSGVACFDQFGTAIIKLYQTSSTDKIVWESIFEPETGADIPVFNEKVIGNNNLTESDRNFDDLLTDWSQLKDTHDFFGLLAKHRVTRTAAMRAAEGRFTFRLSNHVAVDLLSRVSSAGLPFMIFVGNSGIIQIHDGIIGRSFTQNNWLNIMDPKFNLHLRLEGVAEAWHVVKPTIDGNVNSIELYDSEGEQIVSFFSSRKPGTPERPVWAEIIKSVREGVLQ